MINQSTALVRKLKQFFDQRFGLGVWDQGEVTHFGQQEDDIAEFVEYRSTINGKRFSLKIAPAEDEADEASTIEHRSPLARIQFHMNGSEQSGPFDSETLERIRAMLLGNSLGYDRSLIGGHV